MLSENLFSLRNLHYFAILQSWEINNGQVISSRVQGIKKMECFPHDYAGNSYLKIV